MKRVKYIITALLLSIFFVIPVSAHGVEVVCTDYWGNIITSDIDFSLLTGNGEYSNRAFEGTLYDETSTKPVETVGKITASESLQGKVFYIAIAWTDNRYIDLQDKLPLYIRNEKNQAVEAERIDYIDGMQYAGNYYAGYHDIVPYVEFFKFTVPISWTDCKFLTISPRYYIDSICKFYSSWYEVNYNIVSCGLLSDTQVNQYTNWLIATNIQGSIEYPLPYQDPNLDKQMSNASDTDTRLRIIGNNDTTKFSLIITVLRSYTTSSTAHLKFGSNTYDSVTFMNETINGLQYRSFYFTDLYTDSNSVRANMRLTCGTTEIPYYFIRSLMVYPNDYSGQINSIIEINSAMKGDVNTIVEQLDSLLTATQAQQQAFNQISNDYAQKAQQSGDLITDSSIIKPSVSADLSGMTNALSSQSASGFVGLLGMITGNSFIQTILILSITMMLVSYIFFGKKT